MALALLSALIIAIIGGLAALERAFVNSQSGDRQFLQWRQELVEMLDAHLANIDSLMHGFSRRRT